MGSSQSILSPEAAVTVAVVAGALGFGYSQFGPSDGATSSTPTSTEAGSKKGKKKKKTSADPPPTSEEPSGSAPPAPIVVPFPTVIPGGLDGITTPEPEPPLDATKSTKSKKKKKSKLASSATSKHSDSARPSQPGTESKSKSKASGNSTPSTDKERPNTKNKGKQTTPPSTSATPSSAATTRQLNKAQSSISIDTDGSWTRVESRRNKSGRSVDVTTTSASEADPATGNSSPIAERTDADAEADVDEDDREHFYTRSSNPEQRRPLAERMLPKPRKTGVESMLESPDHPPVARVMRVQPQEDEQPALGFSWGDYEDAHDGDVDGEDDNAGWDVVKSRRSRPTRPSTSTSDPSSSQSASASQSQSKKAPETLTKRQRQNAARREAQKAVKEEAEMERRAVLARHQRELESERMKEQGKGKGKKGGKNVSGGMKASVSESGKLVWE